METSLYEDKAKKALMVEMRMHVARMIELCGDNPRRSGMTATPDRFLKAMWEQTEGYRQNSRDLVRLFEDGAQRYDEMVVLTDIPFTSLCEHHLCPFLGVAHVAYIPDKKIIGLSKIPRVVDMFAHRFQVQERLTVEIAECLQTHLIPIGIGVILKCRHMCMECRGIRKSDINTTTSAMLGAMKDKPEARAEFLSFTL